MMKTTDIIEQGTRDVRDLDTRRVFDLVLAEDRREREAKAFAQADKLFADYRRKLARVFERHGII